MSSHRFNSRRKYRFYRPRNYIQLQQAHIFLVKSFARSQTASKAQVTGNTAVSAKTFPLQAARRVIQTINTTTQQATFFRLPKDILFTFDSEFVMPILIDTGASISIIPKRFVDKFEKDFPIEIDGICGKTATLGSITTTLKLNLPINPPHKLYVADVNLDYAIVGMDFLRPRKLTIVVHNPMLIQNCGAKNVSVPLLPGQDGLPPKAWSSFLDYWVNSPIVLPKLEVEQLQSTNNGVKQTHSCNKISSPATEAETQCLDVLNKYPTLTQEPTYERYPRHGHVLDLSPLPNTTVVKPFTAYTKKLNENEKAIVREQFSAMVKRGVLVHQSHSSYSSPVTLVPKRNNQTRICVDYTRLNARTENLQYSLPTIQSLPEILTAKHCIFSAIDLREAYFSLGLTERASELCAISVHGVGSFKPLRAQFGLKQAPAKFQELANEVISGLEEFVFVYLDDFMVYSSSLDEHLIHLDRLFQRFSKFGLFVNKEKCSLGRKSINYLGFHISENGVAPIQDKVEALKKLKSPRNTTELRSFNGSVNFYRRFVPNLAELMAPLTARLKGLPVRGSSKLLLTKEEENARQKVIKALANATSLQFEDPRLPLVITTDATKKHCGAVLEQYLTESEESDLRPLGFFSSKLPKRVNDRSVFQAELTGLYLAIRYFNVRIRHRNLIVRTDHLSLVSAIQNESGCHSPREQSMIAYCKEFSPQMRFIKGKDNIFADMLSRPVEMDDSVNSDTLTTADIEKITRTDRIFSSDSSDTDEQITELHKIHVIDHQPPESEIKKIEPQVFYEKQREDMEFIEQIQSLFKDLTVHCKKIGDVELYGVTSSSDADSGIEMFRVIVPDSLKAAVWAYLHGNIHQGKETTLDSISKGYYWPTMQNDIAYWTRCCPLCQLNKTSRYQKQKLENFPGYPHRLEVIHIDLVGPLVESDGNKYIMTMKDRATGFLWAAALPNKYATTVSNAFERSFVALCGIPSVVVSDQGREFCNCLIDTMFKKNCIRHNITTAYHPQSNGLVERAHKDLKRAINSLHTRSDWSSHLPYFILQMNNIVGDTNAYTPHQRLYGLAAQLPGYLLFPPHTLPEISPDIDTEVFMELMQHHQKYSRPLPDKNTFISKDLFTCDFVFVRNEEKGGNYKSPWKGPYKVLRRKSKYFLLDLISTQKNVTVDRLKVCYPLKQPTNIDTATENYDVVGSHSYDAEIVDASENLSSKDCDKELALSSPTDSRYHLRQRNTLKVPQTLLDYEINTCTTNPSELLKEFVQFMNC